MRACAFVCLCLCVCVCVCWEMERFVAQVREKLLAKVKEDNALIATFERQVAAVARSDLI